MRRSVFIIIILAIGIFYLSTIRPGHVWGGDFSQYIHHAKNLVEGINYENTGYIYNPSNPYVGPRNYPPIYPLIIAPVYKLYGFNLAAMKVELIVLYLIFLVFYSFILKNELSFRNSLLTIMLLVCIPYFWYLKDTIQSEIPFLLFTYISIFIIQKAYQSNELPKNKLIYSLFAGLFIYLSYGTKPLGGILIPCIIIYEIIKYKKLSQFSIATTILFAIAITIHSILFPPDSSYLDQLRVNNLISSIPTHINWYIDAGLVIFDNGYSNLINFVLFIIACILAIIGYIVRVKKNISILELFFLAYLGVIILWPASQGIRYLIPIIPIFLIYVVIGLSQLQYIPVKSVRSILYYLFIIAMFGSYLGRYSKINFDAKYGGIDKKEAIQLFEYIKENTKVDDVFIFRKPRVLALYTDREAATYHYSKNDEDLWNFFESISAKYVIKGFMDDKYFIEFFERNKKRFVEKHSNNDFTIYQIQWEN